MLPSKTLACRRDRRSIGAGLPLTLQTSCDLTSIARVPLRRASAASFKPTLLAVSVFACSMTVAGCAHHPARNAFHPTQHKVGSAPVQTRGTGTYPEQRRYAKAQRYRPDAALLSPQPAPDCEFKAANVEAMDATELARLKIEYERRCYQNAEKAARDRLGLLQGAVQNMRH
jgi:hypothetical protein